MKKRLAKCCTLRDKDFKKWVPEKWTDIIRQFQLQSINSKNPACG